MTAPEPVAPAPWWHALGVPDRVRLVGVAALAAVVHLGGVLLAAPHQSDVKSLDALAVALLLGGPAALLLRRRRPDLALALAFVPTMAYWTLDYPGGPTFLALIIAVANAVMRGYRVLAWSFLGVGYVVGAWVAPLTTGEPWPNWGVAAALAAWLLVLGAVTELVRSTRERAAERAETEAEEARRRTSEERLRIARELHDVLAHNISLINVRAGVALHLVGEQPDAVDPGDVRDALEAIRDASKEALGGLRSVLDVLRQGEAAPLSPTAGLGDLDALAERARGTGLDVSIEAVDGGTVVPAPPGDLPPPVDLAAFRIVQEALTNVVRHADATRVAVRLRRDGDELEVQVDDDGRHPAPDAAGGTLGGDGHGTGRGIAGMRERALALGGTLEAGRRPGRGFWVRATLPLGGAR